MGINNDILRRYNIILFFLILGFVAVIGKETYLMLVEKDKWQAYFDANFRRKKNVSIPAKRGNIFSADGKLLASSVPVFKIYKDFKIGGTDSAFIAENDSLFMAKLDSISHGLSAIFPDKSAAEFKERLLEGKEKQSRNWLLYPKRISYTQFKAVQELPYFKMGRYKSGLHEEKFDLREKPFGSLASRTLGSLYPGKDQARNGLELAYDSILRGLPGKAHTQKILNRYLNIIDRDPVDGSDILTTIDIDMQDICEQALVEKLKEIDGQMGVAILMEVKTGDVKAIVNMTRCSDGQYREVRNDAVSMLLEPGSVFKTASFLVAFDDGYLHMDDHVETGNGIFTYGTAKMKDWNWHRGGYGTISVPECLMYSSNVGVSRLIDKFYHNQPNKYIDGLYRVGIADNLHLPIPGSAAPKVRHVKADGSNWSVSALPWMSIGYESQVPPISTLTFYNAIANGGKMVKPRFVKAVTRKGEVIQEFPVEVLKDKIASDEALNNIRTILEMVVNDPKGLGKKAGTKQFHVSGKTGTAQISGGRAGYKSGGVNYLLSFCGYFPSEDPKYSCIVCLRKSGLPASGGGMAGPVFSKIAEKVYAKNIYMDISYARDSVVQTVPSVLAGDVQAAHYVLEHLEIGNNTNWSQGTVGIPVWGAVHRSGNNLVLLKNQVPVNRMPNVLGMGARDAVFLLESRGVKVSLKGVGKVVSQSIAANSPLRRGLRCQITLASAAERQPMPQPVQKTANKETQNKQNNETEGRTEKDSAETNNRRR